MQENDLFAYAGPEAEKTIVLPLTVIDAVPVPLWPVSSRFTRWRAGFAAERVVALVFRQVQGWGRDAIVRV